MFTISETESLLEVELRGGATVGVILQAVNAVIAHPDYHQRNDVWVIGGEPLQLNFADLDRITDWIARCYPPAAVRTRTALVVHPGLNAALVELWLETAAELPYEVRMFSSREAAVDWARCVN